MDHLHFRTEETYVLQRKTESTLTHIQDLLSNHKYPEAAAALDSFSQTFQKERFHPYCQDNLITDGCCGVRELIAWVQSFMVCGDIQEAAHYTILSSVTADSESRIEIEGSCLDTVLAS